MTKSDNTTKVLSEVFLHVREAESVRSDRLLDLVEDVFEAFVEDLRAVVRVEISKFNESKSRLLMKKDLADRLQVSVSTISKLQTEGLPSIPFGKSVRFEYSEVVGWAKENRIGKHGNSKLRMVGWRCASSSNGKFER